MREKNSSLFIKNFQIYQFSLPFNKTINFNGNHLDFRLGLIIKITDNDNYIGYGEISPLPSFHKETLDDAVDQLLFLKSQLNFTDLPAFKDVIGGTFQNKLIEFNIFPSVQCGIDFAIVNLIADRFKKPFYKLFSLEINPLVQVNGLITELDKNSIFNVKNYLKNGYKTVKIKVGRNDIDSEIKTILDIDKFFHDKVAIRLDANARWEYNEAKYFISKIQKIRALDYIEEPLKDYSLINKLCKDCKVPVALDENLQSYISKFSDQFSNLKACVIKPPIFGGLNITIDFIKFAEKINSNPVISDTFQSGIGLTCLAMLSTIVKNQTAMGLDTFNMIDDDVLNNKFCADNGNVDVKKMHGRLYNLNFNNLTEI